jgi:hypothetical protein
MSAGGRLPDFAIVGTMKSGTTSLATWLRRHPDVFMPATKELHFFGQHWDRGLDWYRAQFAGATDDCVAGEATPGYMFWSGSFDRLAEVLPDARLIALLRHPVERAYSHWWHLTEVGEERRSFAAAIQDERRRKDDTVTRDGYLARGRYHEQLERVAARYPRDRFLVLLFDDLRDEPMETFALCCRFLGVDVARRVEHVGEVVNPRSAPRWSRAESVLTGLGRRQLLPAQTVQRLQAWNRKTTLAPPLASELRGQLIEYFRPDVEAVASWLGRDLTAWTR